MTGLRDTGRHGGNPARETKTYADELTRDGVYMLYSNSPEPTWDEVTAYATPSEVYGWGRDVGRAEASRTRKADYLVVLFILAVGFTIGAVFVGFLR